MKTVNDYKKGLISIIGVLILGVIIILVLGYFHINLQAVVDSPDTQGNIHYIGGAISDFWNTYLAKPASYLWNDVFIKIFWQSFINNMERIRDGQPLDFNNIAPAS